MNRDWTALGSSTVSAAGSLPGMAIMPLHGSLRGSRGLPPPPQPVSANNTQVRVEAAVADQVVVKESLQINQSAAVIGNTVPLVFCREVDGIGGVMVSPPCIRAGFQVSANGQVIANYLCALSDGELADISLSDVWHGGRKLNEFASYGFAQSYGAIPTSVLLTSSFDNGEDAFNYPLDTGSGGDLRGLTLLGVSATYQPNDVGSWRHQVHAFVRSGHPVTRLIDGNVGPSNNFADLVQLLLESSGKIPLALIDTDGLVTAARFTQAEGFFFNGVLASSSSIKDFLARVAPLFMLTVSSKNGKIGLLPSLPINGSYAINTGVITPAATYGLEDIVAGSYRQEFVPLAERKFFRAVMSWRKQPVNDASYVEAVTVGYTGYAVDGPVESYDLSEFCVSEAHAVKIGRFILAQRRYVTHSIQFALLPERAFHEPGDIIRVTINRISSAADSQAFSRLYMITEVTEAPGEVVQITATHFPVDEQGKSIVAQEVINVPIMSLISGEDQCPPPAGEEEPPGGDVGSNTGFIVAFGGTITTDGDYKIHTFTASNTLAIVEAPPGQLIEYLIVAGGGAGGSGDQFAYWSGQDYTYIYILGGGGGGGGVRSGNYAPVVQGYPVVVGQGGVSKRLADSASRGGDSSIFGITASGGGAGASFVSTQSALDGGCGGGANNQQVSSYGLGTAGQGYSGSAGLVMQNAGGGGGAGGAGGSALQTGGAGGVGIASSITGSELLYGGGGGGGGLVTGGTGGAGGGGDGVSQSTEFLGEDGINGRGGGGGGGYLSAVGTGNGGDGGSGVVIIRYKYK